MRTASAARMVGCKHMLHTVLHDRFHLRGDPFVAVIEQLLPNADLEWLGLQVHQPACGNRLLGHIVGQEGDAEVLLQQCADAVGAADLQNGLDLERQPGELFVHQTAVAHAPFRQDERMLHQLAQRDTRLLRQRAAAPACAAAAFSASLISFS